MVRVRVGSRTQREIQCQGVRESGSRCQCQDVRVRVRVRVAYAPLRVMVRVTGSGNQPQKKESGLQNVRVKVSDRVSVNVASSASD